MPFFKNVFKSKDASRSGSKAEASSEPAPRPRWEEAWSRDDVAPEEIQELVHVCTAEMKSRGRLRISPGSEAVGANCRQLLTCRSYCSLSAPLPTRALHETLCATSLKQSTKGHINFEAEAWCRSCAWPSHWYDESRPWAVASY